MYNTRHKPKPRAAVLRQCHRCRGTGRAPCQFCGGTGYVMKKRDFRGNPIHDRCDACFGSKTSKCYSCGGVGTA